MGRLIASAFRQPASRWQRCHPIWTLHTTSRIRTASIHPLQVFRGPSVVPRAHPLAPSRLLPGPRCLDASHRVAELSNNWRGTKQFEHLSHYSATCTSSIICSILFTAHTHRKGTSLYTFCWFMMRRSRCVLLPRDPRLQAGSILTSSITSSVERHPCHAAKSYNPSSPPPYSPYPADNGLLLGHCPRSLHDGIYSSGP